jgi:hypothetical protein
MPGTDQKFDPETRDYIDTEDGGWEEADDSRTAVEMQMGIRYNRWCGNPEDGSRIVDLIESIKPTTIDELRDASLECLQALVAENVIAELVIAADRDQLGNDVLVLNYVDRRNGRPVDLVYSPFGG